MLRDTLSRKGLVNWQVMADFIDQLQWWPANHVIAIINISNHSLQLLYLMVRVLANKTAQSVSLWAWIFTSIPQYRYAWSWISNVWSSLNGRDKASLMQCEIFFGGWGEADMLYGVDIRVEKWIFNNPEKVRRTVRLFRDLEWQAFPILSSWSGKEQGIISRAHVIPSFVSADLAFVHPTESSCRR